MKEILETILGAVVVVGIIVVGTLGALAFALALTLLIGK